MYRLCKITAAWAREVSLSQKGSITIFITIVFLVIIFLMGVFVDLARIKIAQNQLKRALNASTRSVMADYNTKLRTSYGIFGTGRRDFNREFRNYVTANISVSAQQDLNLLDSRYETGNIILIHPVSSNETLRQQILETMKYKAPVEIGREITNKIMQLRNTAAFFDQSNENRKSFRRINEKTKSLHEINQNIKRNGSELEKAKAEYEGIKHKLRLEHDPERAKQLADQRDQLGKRMTRIRSDIDSELHKAQRAGLEIELEVKKIKDNQPRDIYKNSESPNDRLNEKTTAEGTEVKKAAQKDLDSIEKSLQGVKSEIAATKEALQKEVQSQGVQHYLFSSMGIDSASRAYDQIKVLWSKTVYPSTEQAQANSRAKELRQKYPDVSDHFHPVEVKSNANDFETSDGEKAENITGYFRRLFGAINVKESFIAARDEMYINEYVLTYFSYLTSGAKGGVSYPYTKTEAEYICFGKNALPRAVSELYFTRFALDSAGYFAFTKGIPELTLRTIFSLAMGAVEATIDTVKLAALNESVPIVSVHPENPLQNITLTYKDHLRLLLLLNSDEKTKLDRIAELIKARSGIETKEMYTLSAGTATISIKMWFLPMSGLRDMENGPFGTRINNGRCYITKEVEFGY